SKRRAGGERAVQASHRATPANRGARTRTVSCCRGTTAVGRSLRWRRRTVARAAASRRGSSGTAGWRRTATGRSAVRGNGGRVVPTQGAAKQRATAAVAFEFAAGQHSFVTRETSPPQWSRATLWRCTIDRACMCSASTQPVSPPGPSDPAGRSSPMTSAADVAPARRAARVNVIGKSNGVGLARDIDLLISALRAAGHHVDLTIIDAMQAKRRRSPLAQFAARARLAWGRADATVHASRADINVMLEHVWLQYLSTAHSNVVVPNPEWFDRHDRRFLADIDRVWAKTGYTRELFRALGCSTTYIGFDSDDHYDPAIVKQRTYFHL